MAPSQEPELWGRSWTIDAPLPPAHNLTLDDYRRSVEGQASRWIEPYLNSLRSQFEYELRKNNAFPVEPPKITVERDELGAIRLIMKAAARRSEYPVLDPPAIRTPRTTHESW